MIVLKRLKSSIKKDGYTIHFSVFLTKPVHIPFN